MFFYRTSKTHSAITTKDMFVAGFLGSLRVNGMRSMATSLVYRGAMEIHISIDKLVVHISSYLEYFTNTISYSACVGVSMYIFPFASKDVGKSLSGNPTVASCTNIARGRDIEGRQIPLPVKPLEGDLPLPIHSRESEIR